MQILGHRGIWKTTSEANSLVALRNCLAAGFGLETDVRDRAGQPVISHDPPPSDAPRLRQLLEIAQACRPPRTLALNVKADGLAPMIQGLVAEYPDLPYFLFDMSVPDSLSYARLGLRVFTRQSEEEPHCSFYESAAGVWMDCFREDWFDEELMARHLSAGKAVCLVSPELHGRDPQPLWRQLAGMRLIGDERLMLCTDHPQQAAQVFSRSTS